MPIDPDVIKERLYFLNLYINRLESMEFEPHEISSDADIQDLVSHRLHTAVEAMIDIAIHIASSTNLPRAESASDAIQLLGENEILSEELVSRITNAPAQRNVLVHEYHRIDYEIIEKSFQSNLIDLKQFLAEITEYLIKEGIISRS